MSELNAISLQISNEHFKFPDEPPRFYLGQKVKHSKHSDAKTTYVGVITGVNATLCKKWEYQLRWMPPSDSFFSEFFEDELQSYDQ